MHISLPPLPLDPWYGPAALRGAIGECLMAASRKACITGMPGAGKSRLALEVAHALLDAGRVRAVRWVDAASDSAVPLEVSPASQDELIVLDGVTDLDSVDPNALCGPGAVLVTSRIWTDDGSMRRFVAPALSAADAETLIRERFLRVNGRELVEDDDDLRTLLHRLDGLALALVSATARLGLVSAAELNVELGHCGTSAFDASWSAVGPLGPSSRRGIVELFRGGRPQAGRRLERSDPAREARNDSCRSVLDRSVDVLGDGPTDHPASLATALRGAIEALTDDDRATLAACATFDLRVGLADLVDALDRSRCVVESSLDALERRSLVRFAGLNPRSVDVHPLLRRSMRDRPETEAMRLRMIRWLARRAEELASKRYSADDVEAIRTLVDRVPDLIRSAAAVALQDPELAARLVLAASPALHWSSSARVTVSALRLGLEAAERAGARHLWAALVAALTAANRRGSGRADIDATTLERAISAAADAGTSRESTALRLRLEIARAASIEPPAEAALAALEPEVDALDDDALRAEHGIAWIDLRLRACDLHGGGALAEPTSRAAWATGSTELKTMVLIRMTRLAIEAVRLDEAISVGARALELAKAGPLPHLQGFCQLILGDCYANRGEYAKARAAFGDVLQLASVTDGWHAAQASVHLGILALLEGESARALGPLLEAVRQYRLVDRPDHLRWALCMLAIQQRITAGPRAAATYLREAKQIEGGGDPFWRLGADAWFTALEVELDETSVDDARARLHALEARCREYPLASLIQVALEIVTLTTVARDGGGRASWGQLTAAHHRIQALQPDSGISVGLVWLRHVAGFSEVIEEFPPKILIAPNGSAVETVDGCGASLEGRSALSAILKRLTHTLMGERDAASWQDLAAAGWSDEVIGKVHHGRVRTAVYQLRRLGLGEALISGPDGYRLDPAVVRVGPLPGGDR